MTPIILSGKEVAWSMQETLRQRAEALAAQGVTPTLATVRVGEDDADQSYERGIRTSCTAIGIALRQHILAQDAGQAALEELVQRLSGDPTVHGILIFRPLPAGYDDTAIGRLLVPEKDVDCMTDGSLSGLYLGSGAGFPPCTPEACLHILRHYGIDPAGRHAVVIGRSPVVGRPLATMLLRENATVTVCHSKTADLPAICRSADLLLVAAGRERLVNAEHIQPGAVVLDIGIHWNEVENRLVGDVDFDAAAAVAGAITPVPGGVGAVTATVLAGHVVAAAEALGRKTV